MMVVGGDQAKIQFKKRQLAMMSNEEGQQQQ